MKKAFTLIELLVVIGILAALFGVLMPVFSGSTESALSARCLANMKSLATSCQTAQMGDADGKFPTAYSQSRTILDSAKNGKLLKHMMELPGWISWYSAFAFDSGPETLEIQDSWNVSTYDPDYRVRDYCLSRGTLWKPAGQNADLYLCPKHRRTVKGVKQIIWSYQMFKDIVDPTGLGTSFGAAGMDRKLLFAELQFLPNANGVLEYEPITTPCHQYDCTLDPGEKETIGVNHVSGKNLCAHIVFGDGHVEKLVIPSHRSNNGVWWIELSHRELEDVTTWLCAGQDITFTGTKFEVLQ